jgi:hypothetical protein
MEKLVKEKYFFLDLCDKKGKRLKGGDTRAKIII